MNNLPDDVLKYILSYIYLFDDFLAIRLACKVVNSVSDDYYREIPLVHALQGGWEDGEFPHPPRRFICTTQCLFCDHGDTSDFFEQKIIWYDQFPRRVFVFCPTLQCRKAYTDSYSKLAARENKKLVLGTNRKFSQVLYYCPRSDGSKTLAVIPTKWMWNNNKVRCIWNDTNNPDLNQKFMHAQVALDYYKDVDLKKENFVNPVDFDIFQRQSVFL